MKHRVRKKYIFGFTDFFYKVLFSSLIVLVFLITSIVLGTERIEKGYAAYLEKKESERIEAEIKESERQEAIQESIEEESQRIERERIEEESKRKDIETRRLNEFYKTKFSRKNYKEGTMVRKADNENIVGRVTEIQGLRCICGNEDWYFEVSSETGECAEVVKIGYKEYLKKTRDKLEKNKYKLSDEEKIKLNRAIEDLLAEGKREAQKLFKVNTVIEYNGEYDKVVKYDGLILITKKGKRILATDKGIKKADRDGVKKYLGIS